MAGFVYVMSNPSLSEGLLKIGKSDKDPTKYRVDELQTTGVPEPFKVEYYAFIDDPDALERTVHSLLSKTRHSANREFFKCSIEEAVKCIQENALIKFEDFFYEIIDEPDEENSPENLPILAEIDHINIKHNKSKKSLFMLLLGGG